MNISTEVRADVRAAYYYRCGYCGVHENWVGNELEIEHFHPRAHGGTDEMSNLVYTCTACNRFKGSYWPADDAPDSFRLLHPLRDDVDAHIAESSNGRLVGLTPRGWFHIRWLHLNRHQLIELRRLHQRERGLREALAQAKETKAQLQARILDLEAEIAKLQAVIARLTE
ncbi:MAG: HNH endonuclease [Chloroflexota bacterium]